MYRHWSKEIFWLVIILVISIFLRFYKLGSIPNGLYVDEAVTGYNAYSILETGKDEYGKVFPIAFRFFGSYSPPLYVYLTSLVINFWGLNVFSTRFVSAAFGVLGTVITFLFLKNLKFLKNPATPILGSLVFTIAPWSIFFSRAGYELNLGATIFWIGLTLLLLGLSKHKFLTWGILFISISTYGAHPERFLAPLFLIGFIFLFKKRIPWWAIVLTVITQLPNIYLAFTPAFATKTSLLFGTNNPYIFLREFLSQYLTYFSPRSLFFLGDSDLQRGAPGLSVFYSWLVAPYLAGLYILWKNRQDLFQKFLIFSLFVSPLPVALASDPFSSQRALQVLLPILSVIMIGVDYFLSRWGRISFLVLFALIPVSLVYLWRSYFILLPHERASVWGYGFDKLALEIGRNPETKYLIDQGRIKPAYIELAFFLKYPPALLQRSAPPGVSENYYRDINFSENYVFGNIETGFIKWEKDIYLDQVLVGDEYSVSAVQAREHFLTKAFEIKDPTNRIVFVGYKTDPAAKCNATNNLSVYCKEPK